MNKIVIAFIISFIASISSLFGIALIFLPKKFQNTIIPFALAFSAGVMLAISLFSLIPDALFYIAVNISFISIIILLIFFVLGICISFSVSNITSKKIRNNQLYRLGIISILILMLHNIPEGITSFLAVSTNFKVGILLSIGIFLHNIPEGIAIAVPIYYSTYNKAKAIFYTALAGFSELFGTFIAYFILSKYLNSFMIGCILIITAGVMMHVSISELIPNSLKYHNDNYAILGLAIGFILMTITICIL